MRLTSSSLLDRNRLNQDKQEFVFHFQNNLVLTSKDEEVRCTETSPFRIKVSIPWSNPLKLWTIDEDWLKTMIDLRLIERTWNIAGVSNFYKTYTNLTNLAD